MSGYPYLYIYPQGIGLNIAAAFNDRICVKQCPIKNENLLCKDGMYNGYCSSHQPDEKTVKLLDRFCMPSTAALATSLFNKFFGFLQAQEYFNAIFEVWWTLIIGAILSIALSMILVILMKYIAGLIILIMCVLMVGGLGFGGYYC